MEIAFCEICGKEWAALDPGVRYVHGDGRWECVEEVPCFDRRSMQRALDWTWEQLERVGWAFGSMPPARPGK
jgi:hypothetical protein